MGLEMALNIVSLKSVTINIYCGDQEQKTSLLSWIFITLLNNIKIMETKLKIVYILVNYQSSKEPNQEYWTTRQFNTSLRSNPLSSEKASGSGSSSNLGINTQHSIVDNYLIIKHINR